MKLDAIAISVNGTPVVSIPIAICLFFMMYPIMVKIDCASVVKAGKSGRQVFLTLFVIAIYVALPLVAGFFSRKWIIAARGPTWFSERFPHVLTPVTIIALLITLVLLLSFKGEVILSNPLTILWIAIPLFIQTNLIFWIGYGLSKPLRLTYEDAARAAMISASNHFEVAIATATMLLGLSSGAVLATVVGVLIEVPVMPMLVRICLKTQGWFKHA